jgi:XTP/dITP diphosphohydrolase
MRLVMASANPHKVEEIAHLLARTLPGVEVVPRPEGLGEVVEDAGTLLGNARLKARAVMLASGEASVADDTGLEVAALDGAPGVDAAIYAGDDATYADNVAKLLSELHRVGAMEPGQRGARFRTVAVVMYPDGTELVAEGEVDGSIALEPRGDTGFGYDPVFVPDEADGRSFAELGTEVKHQLSHRARAFEALAAALRGSAG